MTNGPRVIVRRSSIGITLRVVLVSVAMLVASCGGSEAGPDPRSPDAQTSASDAPTPSSPSISSMPPAGGGILPGDPLTECRRRAEPPTRAAIDTAERFLEAEEDGRPEADELRRRAVSEVTNAQRAFQRCARELTAASSDAEAERARAVAADADRLVRALEDGTDVRQALDRLRSAFDHWA